MTIAADASPRPIVDSELTSRAKRTQHTTESSAQGPKAYVYVTAALRCGGGVVWSVYGGRSTRDGRG